MTMRFLPFILLSAWPIALGEVAPADPLITPAPSHEAMALARRQGSSRMDMASLAQVLLTGVPPSILGLALTNVPSVSRLLWSEFLDDHTPAWFTALPTDVQAYLSGEFGPTTALSNTASATSSTLKTSTISSGPSTSQTAASNQVQNPHSHHGDGLPLWAIILIGVLVPLLVIALLALVLLFCCRRRRRHRAARAHSRTPTPAFISSSHRRGPHDAAVDQHDPLRRSFISSTESNRHHSGCSHHLSSESEEFQTPIGGASHENLAPAVGTPGLRRSSRRSLSSLRSVPEVPEPMHNLNGGPAPIPLPSRSPRRSRDLSHERQTSNGAVTNGNKYRRISPLSPASNGANPYDIEKIYTGGHNPYPEPSYPHAGNQAHGNPFADDKSQRRSGYFNNHGYTGDTYRDPELFIPGHGNTHGRAERDGAGNWPLQAPADGLHRSTGGSRPHEVYEKVYEM